MSYLALYRKYRPQTFEEVYGQRAVIRTLTNAFSSGKIGHAYLFCGPRGTGKTSMARLFAKALNCAEGVGKQCCRCESCLAIASGSHPDVIEMDAASNSSVTDIRGIISQVDYQPIMGRYKVYIIDEVHNISDTAFNALLKTLEEPPESVVFILCTTEPQKVLPTIVSRVQRFDFSRVADTDLIADMERICRTEKIAAEPEALKKIASLADGGVRDALSLLDQAVSFSGKKITLKDVEELFGLVDPESLCKLLKLAHSGDVSALMRTARDLVSRGMDISRATRDMASICRDLLLLRAGGSRDMTTAIDAEQADSLFEFTADDCDRYLGILVKGLREYRYSSDLSDAFEIVLLQLASTGLGEAETPAEKAPVIKASGAIKESSAPRPKAEIKKESTPVSKIETEPEPAPDVEPVKGVDKRESAPVIEPVAPAPEPLKTPGSDRTILPEQAINLMVSGNKELRQRVASGWNRLDVKQEALRSALADATVSVCSEGGILLTVPLKIKREFINKAENAELLTGLISDEFGFAPQVGAVTKSEYTALIKTFKEMQSQGRLPSPGPVDLFGDGGVKKKAEKKTAKKEAVVDTGTEPDVHMTNAEAFIRGLGGGVKR